MPPAVRKRPSSKKSETDDILKASYKPPIAGTKTLLALAISVAAALIYILGTNRSTDTLFELRDLPGKGKGLVATRDIQRGELLIREPPLILVPRETYEAPASVIGRELDTLNTSQQKAFYALSYVHLPADTPPEDFVKELPLAIFETNSVSAGAQVGVFPTMARMNHACSSAFNAVYFWREDEGVIVVHALKPIRKGEELLTAYINTKVPRAERQKFLLAQYDFNCTCAVCSLPPDASRKSDARLSEMVVAYRHLASWATGDIKGVQAVATVQRIWDLGEAEGYTSERGRLAADAVQVAAAHSDERAVRKWARLAKQWYGYEVGRDSVQVSSMEKIISHPQSHRAWGTRQPMGVGEPGQR